MRLWPTYFNTFSDMNRTESERIYPHAAYERLVQGEPLTLIASDATASPVRWSSVVDPTAPGALGPEAHPITITVDAGESLYLPAGWWHYVRQSGITVAVNYWYDMEYSGSFYPLTAFAKKAETLVRRASTRA